MKETSKKAVCLCSGGMDSVTTLALAAAKGHECHVLFVDYGQKTANRERAASKTAAEGLGAQWKEFVIRNLSEITKTSLIHANGKTEVQGRNALLLCLAVTYAQTLGINSVFIGLQAEDVSYKDAQPTFFKHMAAAVNYAYGIKLMAPLLHKNKIEIIKLARKLHVDLNLTYSCYFNPLEPCGECSSCKVRREAEKIVKNTEKRTKLTYKKI
jgi:7-cyano-7-deazaguanine synthase